MAKIKNWDKVKDTNNEQVWVNSKKTFRVVVAKGNSSFTSWLEKNLGRIASDESYIRNAYFEIPVFATREQATNGAIKYMRSHK